MGPKKKKKRSQEIFVLPARNLGELLYRVRLERERKGKGNITERKKGARGHGKQRLNHKQQEETQRKLFGQSSTTLSFVTLGQNL